MTRHAEIAGGGIGGLSLGVMLRKCGWSVRVHERTAAVRGTGTGIFLKNNFAEVLEEAGMFDNLVGQSSRLDHMKLLDHTGALMQSYATVGQLRLFCTTRRVLYQSFYGSAVQAGVEVKLDSTAMSADPAGVLITAEGRRWPADLVVAADGVNSRVRDTLGVAASVVKLPTIITRYLIPTHELAPEPTMFENWYGHYRVSTSPCTEDFTWACRVYPAWDRPAGAEPCDVKFWTGALPHQRRLFEVMANLPGISSHYTIVRCAPWRKGRVAIVGDAAHGLPPTLGQGAGLTVMNVRALVAALARKASVEEALVDWEQAVRPVSEATQRWSIRYDLVTRRWPRALWAIRPALIWAISRPRILSRMLVADRGLRATGIGIMPPLQPESAA
jgi:2-polyprenyl-6-methoxyphenol hydroxylase-like FAD-dependent oxidoreductase